MSLRRIWSNSVFNSVYTDISLNLIAYYIFLITPIFILNKHLLSVTLTLKHVYRNAHSRELIKDIYSPAGFEPASVFIGEMTVKTGVL